MPGRTEWGAESRRRSRPPARAPARAPAPPPAPAPAPAPAPTTAGIQGTVSNTAGAPLNGARVAVIDGPNAGVAGRAKAPRSPRIGDPAGPGTNIHPTPTP